MHITILNLDHSKNSWGEETDPVLLKLVRSTWNIMLERDSFVKHHEQKKVFIITSCLTGKLLLSQDVWLLWSFAHTKPIVMMRTNISWRRRELVGYVTTETKISRTAGEGGRKNLVTKKVFNALLDHSKDYRFVSRFFSCLNGEKTKKVLIP